MSDAAAKSHASGSKRLAIKKAVALQNLCIAAAKDISPAVSGEKFSREDAALLPALVKGWDTAANRGRVLRGQPLPGSLKPVAKPRHSQKPKNKPPVTPNQIYRAPGSNGSHAAGSGAE